MELTGVIRYAISNAVEMVCEPTDGQYKTLSFLAKDKLKCEMFKGGNDQYITLTKGNVTPIKAFYNPYYREEYETD